MRRILANLDGEAELAAAAGGRPNLPRAAREAAAAAGTLLRALGRAGDRLHTPVAVTAERLAEVGGLPRPRLETGPPETLEPTAELLAWIETPRAAALRRAARPAETTEPDAPLHELLWRLPPPAPAAVAAVHHRGFAHRLARELGRALPGARLVGSTAELWEHLEAGGAGAGAGGRWVLKAPYSAAGRERVLAAGARGAALERRVERLLEGPIPLLFEPWMERTADFGAAALALPGGVRLLGLHRSLVDRRGRFVGIELHAGAGGAPGLDAAEAGLLRETAAAVGRALDEHGYVGPFGIDAWRYLGPAGEPAFHPLGELNARLTMGLVARALVERLQRPLEIADGTLVRLRLGRRTDAGSRVVPLLHPGPPGGLAAWLETATAKDSPGR